MTSWKLNSWICLFSLMLLLRATKLDHGSAQRKKMLKSLVFLFLFTRSLARLAVAVAAEETVAAVEAVALEARALALAAGAALAVVVAVAAAAVAAEAAASPPPTPASRPAASSADPWPRNLRQEAEGERPSLLQGLLLLRQQRLQRQQHFDPQPAPAAASAPSTVPFPAK